MSHDVVDRPLSTTPEPEKPAAPRLKRRGFLGVAVGLVAGAAAGVGGAVAAQNRPSQSGEGSASQPEGAPTGPEAISEAAQKERRRLEAALNDENIINRRPEAVVFVSASAQDGNTVVRNPILLAPGQTPVWGRVVREEVDPGIVRPVITIVPFTGPLTMLQGQGFRSEARSGTVLDNTSTDTSDPTLYGFVDGTTIPIGTRVTSSGPGGE